MADRVGPGRLLRLGKRIGQRLRAARRGPPPVPERTTVVFQTDSGQRVEGEVPGGISLLACARHLDVRVTHYCGGMCSCGTCRVEVVDGADLLSPALPNERMVLGAERDAAGDRLACQARVLGPVVVRVPDWF